METDRMSTLTERIEQAFSTLTDMVEGAEKAKTEGAAVVAFANKVKSLVASVDGLADEAKYQIIGALGDKADAWVSTYAGLKATSDALSIAAGMDRTKGDESVSALQALLTLNAFDDMPEDKAKAEDLIQRWQASAPTKSRGTGSGKEWPALGFKVAASCQVQGCGYRATTEKANLNSLRDQCKGHAKTAHKVLSTEKGTPMHQGLTEAIQKVFSGEAQAVEGGNYVVAKVAA